ncbi:A24 family peptidase [Tatumella citrea]|nr:prepilin peptidase [Tatumella citrea]
MFIYSLLVLLLLSVCYTDISSRKIKNNTVMLVALLSLIIAVTINGNVNILWPLMTLIVGMLLVIANVIGAGDIKLIAALSLSIPADQMVNFLFLVTLSGIPLILIVIFLRLLHKGSRKMTLPYGVAISCGYLLLHLG